VETGFLIIIGVIVIIAFLLTCDAIALLLLVWRLILKVQL